MTNYSRSVLKSNGLHRPKIRLKKFGFSLKIVPANISKKLPAQVLSQIVFHPVFQLLSQMSHVCFHGRKRVHARLCQQDRTQRPTRRNRGRFRWGVSLPSERSARLQTSPGRVSAQQTLLLLGLGRVYSRRTQRAFGTAMRLCASLFRGVAAPLGCVIQ